MEWFIALPVLLLKDLISLRFFYLAGGKKLLKKST